MSTGVSDRAVELVAKNRKLTDELAQEKEKVEVLQRKLAGAAEILGVVRFAMRGVGSDPG